MRQDWLRAAGLATGFIMSAPRFAGNNELLPPSRRPPMTLMRVGMYCAIPPDVKLGSGCSCTLAGPRNQLPGIARRVQSTLVRSSVGPGAGVMPAARLGVAVEGGLGGGVVLVTAVPLVAVLLAATVLLGRWPGARVMPARAPPAMPTMAAAIPV